MDNTPSKTQRNDGQSLEDVAVALLQDLIDIPSVSGSEEQIADFTEAYLEALEYLEVQRFGNCIVARSNVTPNVTPNGTSSQKPIILAGHLDTVPISEVTNNVPSKVIETEAEGEVTRAVWGRGAVDMKAGVAVQLMLASALRESPTPITYIFYDNEEVASELNGLGKLVETHPELLEAKFAVLLEPTDGYIEAGCNGTMRFDLIFRGKAAHSARASQGDNAIHKMEKALDLLNIWNKESHLETVGGLVYAEGLNATLVSGGQGTNIIPDNARLHINYRFAPSKTLTEAKGMMEKLFADFEIEWKDLSDSARPGLELPEVQQFAELTKSMTGKEVRAKLGWTDVARFSALKIPALNFAPGDPNLCHTDDERVELSSVVECFEVLHEFLA